MDDDLLLRACITYGVVELAYLLFDLLTPLLTDLLSNLPFDWLQQLLNPPAERSGILRLNAFLKKPFYDLTHAIDATTDTHDCGMLHGRAVRQPVQGFLGQFNIDHWGILQHYITRQPPVRHYLSVYHMTVDKTLTPATYTLVHQPLAVFTDNMRERAEALHCICDKYPQRCPLRDSRLRGRCDIKRTGEEAVKYARGACRPFVASGKYNLFGLGGANCHMFGYWVLTGMQISPRTAPLWASLFGFLSAACCYIVRLWHGHIHWILMECLSSFFVVLIVLALAQIAKTTGTRFPVPARKFIAVLVILSVLPTEVARFLLWRLLG